MNRNILITGANGQLGSEIRFLSSSLKDTFFFTDKSELDITNEAAVFDFFENNKINVVLNCAAYTAVDAAESNTELAYLVNSIAVKNLAKACKKFDASIIHVSTDYVFQGDNFKPYEPSDEVSPINVYGETKLDGENFLKEINPMNSAIIRTSWVYSSFGNNFVKTMLRLGKERDTLNVISDQVGTPTYARDLAAVMIKFYQEFHSNTVETFHYTNEGVCSWYDFAEAIMNNEGLSCDVKPIPTSAYPTPAKRPHYSVMNKSKIKETLNIEIPHWRKSLLSCLQTINNTL